ncbi:hypothetical protein H0262_05485 [Psychrobacter cryohalolentis]|uniref:structural cement protein Gp24 n=1 Tax=Psychrobacter sp. D2 TaxID=2759702 RepID=UPI0015E61F0B|nr:hypothetical protein [Psychrobacter sp. D2]MBA2057333.1 hypothetical protein [Psychrobacter sp. D2]
MTPLLKGDDAIAVAGMRVKSMPEEVLSLPLLVDPSYTVKDGSVVYLTADKKGCTTVQNVGAGYVGIVVLNGMIDSYKKGDVVPVMVRGKIWSPSVVKITDLTTVVGADATGQITATTTAIGGVRFGGLSVGSQNLTVIEILGA